MDNKSNNLYYSAFSDIVDSIIITDGSTGKIVDVNKSCVDMFKCSKSDLIGTKISSCFDSVELDGIGNSADRINMYGSVLSNKKLKISDGTVIPVDLTINTFNCSSSHYVMTTLRDVSERIKYEEKILVMNAELRELNASKDKLFSIIAHDLKNPLMAMMGLSEFLTEESGGITPEELGDMAESINKLSKDTYQLLQNLLNWALVQTNRISVEKQQTDLKLIVEKVFDLLAPSAKLKNISLINSVEEGCRIFADENMIKTVIRNLVSNSIKFTYEGKSISVSTLETDKQHILLVEDEGVGMEQEYIDNLFRIDVQTSKPGTKKERGTGLGLIICDEFVKLHDGEIKIKSELEKGTKFFIHIPK